MRWLLAILLALALPSAARCAIILPTNPAVIIPGAGLQATPGNCLQGIPGFCLLATPATQTALGAYVGGAVCAKLATFATWLNRSPGSMYLLDYLTPSNLSNIDTVIQALGGCNAGQHLNLSLAIGTETDLGPIDTYANMIGGGDDVYYQEVATQLATYAPNTVIRLGWEMNGNNLFFDWSIGSPPGGYGFTAAQYIAVFQHFVTVMKAAGLPSSVKIEWNSALCPSPACTDSYGAGTGYPGDAYVDIVGIDGYEHNIDGDSSGWATYWTTPKNGLAAQVAFAKAHNKQLGLGEWGVGYPSGSLNDTQAPYIIGQMKNWLNNAAGANGYQPYVYFSYFDTNKSDYCGVINGDVACPDGTPATNGPPYQLPNSAAAFLSAFAVP